MIVHAARLPCGAGKVALRRAQGSACERQPRKPRITDPLIEKMLARTRYSAAVLALICLCGILAGCGANASRPARLSLAGVRAEDRSVGGAHTSTSSVPFRFFARTSFWNEPLAANAPLDPTSAALVGALDEKITAEEQAENGPWINTTEYSIPVYTVPAHQPTVPVQLLDKKPNAALSSAWSAVPLPPNAQPAIGTDGVLAIWQPSTDRLWEFWRLVHEADSWHASWGGAMQHVSSNPGVYGPEAWPGAQSWWGVSASSLSLVGGLISLEDLKLGQINHALEMAIPNVRAGVYSSPAQRTDGKSASPLSLPEGGHLRLNPNLNLAALHLPRLTLMLAEAAQRYGIFISDGSSIAEFYAQDPTPTGTNPYAGPGGYYEGNYPNQLLASFPWSQLQLLKLELHNTKLSHRLRRRAMRHHRAPKRQRRHG
jgi:hypothetical protein